MHKCREQVNNNVETKACRHLYLLDVEDSLQLAIHDPLAIVTDALHHFLRILRV